MEQRGRWRGLEASCQDCLLNAAASGMRNSQCGAQPVRRVQSILQHQLKELLGQQQSGHRQSHNSSILQINRYRPPSPAATVEEARGGFRVQGCEAHVDKGLLTVIHATGPGLEVFSRDGRVPVDPAPGQLVILVGHTLSFMTAGRLPAALHRVAIPAADNRGSKSSRLSLCFKLHAAPDALLSPAKVTGARADLLALRYRVPKTTQQLLADFDATYTSIHTPHSLPGDMAGPAQQPQPEQQQLQGPQLDQRAPARRCTQSMLWADNTSSSPAPAQKRQRLQSTLQDSPLAADQAGKQKVLEVKLFMVSDHGTMTGEVLFKIKTSTKLGKVMEAYTACMGIDITKYRFIWDGMRLDPTCRAADYEIEDGEEILVALEQLGD